VFDNVFFQGLREKKFSSSCAHDICIMKSISIKTLLEKFIPLAGVSLKRVGNVVGGII
jgi:hypothetical protein